MEGFSSWAAGATPTAARICPRPTSSTRSEIAGRRPQTCRRRGEARSAASPRCPVGWPLREVLRHLDQRVDLVWIGADRPDDRVSATGLGKLLEPLDDLAVGSEQVALLE